MKHVRDQQFLRETSLNQYTSRVVPGYLDILGTVTNTAAVTVNHVPASRKGDYYRAEVRVENGATAVWQAITNVAVLAVGTNDMVTNSVGYKFLPKSVETFGYDADGNQTNDGRWAMTWDGENRLVLMQSLPSAPIGSSNRLTFVYDQQSRRVARTTESFASGAWCITLSNRFLYDAWNLLAELNATNNAAINAFVWGLDLSGSFQGAGGVGGLLAVTSTNAGTHFVGYDGNGNVTVMASASNGAATANYEYDPFGNVLRATGPMAFLNPFRFSTKYTDSESAFNYYGYRSYNPAAGRWLSRDPISETGGFNLLGFCGNAPVRLYDRLGQDYYILIQKGKCGVNHRVMIGDDGKGGSFEIEIVPLVNHWWQSFRRVCGEGKLNYTPRVGSATNYITGEGTTIDHYRKIGSDYDLIVAEKAKALDGKSLTYCLDIQDCRSIEKCVLTQKLSLGTRISEEFDRWLEGLGTILDGLP